MLSSRILIFVTLLFSCQVFALDDLYRLDWLRPESVVASEVTYPQLVNDIYVDQEYQLVWYDKAAMLALEQQLKLIDYAGLSELFSRRLLILKQLRTRSELFQYDILATDTLLSYALYAELAKTDGFDWFYGGRVEVELPTIDPNGVLVNQILQHLNDDSLASYVTSLSGIPDQLGVVSHVLEAMEQSLADVVPIYMQVGNKRLGDDLRDRKTLIRRLEIVGLDTAGLDVESLLYDTELESLILEFQRMHGLKEDGVIGRNTLYWINMPYEKRMWLIALNSERARLIPRDKQNVVIVNLPSFRLHYWHNGEQLFSTRVIVGRKKRKTPLLRVTMDTLVLNPSWNVPRKLVREDLIPKIKQDITYLERKNIKIIKSWSTFEEVNPYSIDWETVNPWTFPYNMTQAPGKLNALGQYKFNTPNPDAIYLHDTPSKSLFKKTYRAFSSGCIRVEHADRFARTLLGAQGMALPMSSSLTEPVSRHVSLRKKIPVHILYQTSWVQSGKIQYRSDIYGYDRKPSIIKLTKK